MRPVRAVQWLTAPSATRGTTHSQPLWPATSTAPLHTTLMLPLEPVFSVMELVPLAMEQATRVA